MQNTIRDKVKTLLAKGVSLTCIKRVHGLSINEIIQISNENPNQSATVSSARSRTVPLRSKNSRPRLEGKNARKGQRATR